MASGGNCTEMESNIYSESFLITENLPIFSVFSKRFKKVYMRMETEYLNECHNLSVRSLNFAQLVSKEYFYLFE